MKRLIHTILVSIAACSTAFADLRVDRKLSMTTDGPQAAMLARLPGTASETSVIIKGNRRLTTGPMAAEIVDLDEEKIYHLDLRRRKYTITTFAEIQQQNRDAEALYERFRPADDPAYDALRMARALEQAQRSRFEMVRKQTGRRRTINGFEALEVVTTTRINAADVGAGSVTVVEWLVPEIANYGELEEFERRYREKIGQPAWRTEMTDIQAASALNPFAELMMANNRIEDDGTKGIAVLTVTVVGNPQAATTVEPPRSRRSRSCGVLPEGLGDRLSACRAQAGQTIPATSGR